MINALRGAASDRGAEVAVVSAATEAELAELEEADARSISSRLA